MPGIGTIGNMMSALWVERGSTPEKRQSILDDIEERQKGGEKGVYPILHIFPEASTTNGSYIV